VPADWCSLVNAKKGGRLMESELEERADNSDVVKGGEATAIRELQSVELVSVGGGIQSSGLLHIDK